MCRDLGFWDFCVFRDLGFRVAGVLGFRVLGFCVFRDLGFRVACVCVCVERDVGFQGCVFRDLGFRVVGV